MSSSLQIAVLQLSSNESIDRNLEQIVDQLEKLPSGQIDLVCLPENSLFFRIKRATAMPEIPLIHRAFVKLQSIVDAQRFALMVTTPLTENRLTSNATVLLEPGKSPKVLYRKVHLFDVDVLGAPSVRESEAFDYGAEPTVWTWKGWRIGLSICYDLRFSELYRAYSKAGVDLILIPSAFLVPTGQAHWEVLVRARAIESQCFVAAAAQGGEHLGETGEKRYTYGHSLVVNPWGEVVLELSEANRTGFVKIDTSLCERVRQQIPMAEHRRRRKWERD